MATFDHAATTHRYELVLTHQHDDGRETNRYVIAVPEGMELPKNTSLEDAITYCVIRRCVLGLNTAEAVLPIEILSEEQIGSDKTEPKNADYEIVQSVQLRQLP